jgi:hypothetical protein
METLKTCVIVPTLVVIFISFLIRNREWNTPKKDVLLFQTCYHVVAQILVETFLCSHHAPTTYKKKYHVELISFLIQICRQGQHLELLGY